MEKYNGSKRAIALLCAVILVFSTALTGCSVKKITKKTSKGADDTIKIGEGTDEDASTTIVVGEDGKSYVVDSEGNSVVYNPTSTAVIKNGNSGVTVPTQASAVTPTQGTTTTTTTTTKAVAKETTTQKSDVFNDLAYQRKFGFNKAYDMGARYVNFYLDTIRAYFEYDDKYWLIEFWKGEYAMASVGCEIGFYTASPNTTAIVNPLKKNSEILEEKGPEYIRYNSVSDSDAMYCSMKLWHYEKSTDTKPVQKINFPRTKCWWAADFENGVLEKHSDRTPLIMVGTVEFPNSIMRNLFTEQLEEKGFNQVASGSITSYDKYDVFAVSGNTVTVGWRYFSEE